MPRTRKTSSGAPAQPIQAIPGQEYGRGVQQEAMQRSMPTPAAQTVEPQSTTNSSSIMPEQGSPRQQMDPAQLAQILRGVGGLLNRPDDRPDVSYTQTLDNPRAAMDAGVMPMVNRTGEIMRDLTRRTGDSTFADLAAKAGF